MKTKILITGAAGFLGSHLVTALKDLYDVLALDKNYHEFDEQVQFLWQPFETVDRLNIEDVSAVIHCANEARIDPSWQHYEKYYQTNLTNTAKFFEYCQSIGIKKFIYVSSSSAKHPFNPYAISKLASEYTLKALTKDCQLIIARPFTIYGPGMVLGNRGTAIGKFIDRYLNKLPLEVRGEGTQRRDYIHVDDVVRAMLLLLDKADPGTYDVGTGQNVSINEIADVFETNVLHAIPKGIEYDTLADRSDLEQFGFAADQRVLKWLKQQKQDLFKELIC